MSDVTHQLGRRRTASTTKEDNESRLLGPATQVVPPGIPRLCREGTDHRSWCLRKADSTSYQLIQKWKEEEITPGKGAVEPIINVHSWLSRTTLDIIGESEYNVSFLG